MKKKKGKDYKEAQEKRRRRAQEKRAESAKCWLCGRRGHTRRDCPGVEDGGSGQSLYRGKGKKKKKKKKERGQHTGKDNELASLDPLSIVLPPTSGACFVDSCVDADSLARHWGWRRRGDDSCIPLAVLGRMQPHCVGIVAALRVRPDGSVSAPFEGIATKGGEQEDEGEGAEGGRGEGVGEGCSVGAAAAAAAASSITTANTSAPKCVIKYAIGLGPREAALAARAAKLDAGDVGKGENVLEKLSGVVNAIKAACESEALNPVAIGPIGLDYRGVEADEKAQREALRLQLELAQELHLPVILKIRPEMRYTDGCARAERDAAAALLAVEKARKDTSRVLPIFLSAFCGRPATLPKLLKGFPQMVVSFNGVLTYRSARAKDESVDGAQSLRDVCFDIPLDRLLLESGAPECRPRSAAIGGGAEKASEGCDEETSYDPRLDDAAFRAEASALFGGKANAADAPSLPRHIPLVASVIASDRAALGVSLATVLKAARKNAARVFAVREWDEDEPSGEKCKAAAEMAENAEINSKQAI